MIKKPIAGVFLASLAMFAWGFIFWAGFGALIRPMKTLPADQEQAVVEALTRSPTATDVYYVPGMPEASSGPAHDAWFEKHKAGPIVGVIFVNEGKDPMAAGTMIAGWVHMFFTAAGLALCLNLAAPRLLSYGRRVAFVGFLGALTAFWIDVGEVIWMYHPAANALFNMLYHFSGIAVAGLILAAFVKPPRLTT